MLHWRRHDCLWHLMTFCPFSICQIPLLLEAMTQEWRFHVAVSVPVPICGNNLETHLIVNPSGICPTSRLCLPLCYLRCPRTPILPWSHPLVLHLCLPSPPWDYWDPSLPWKTHTMVPNDFLKLFPHLVCQTPRSKGAVSQLLGAGEGKNTCRKLRLHPQREEGKQTCKCMHSGCRPLGIVVILAIPKEIHREGPGSIQSCQPNTAATATHHHSPKKR
jgi:hypothetical protein